ncbi:MAG TPA: HXXEE domain-containing protein [Vicinamibacterales bacterium]|nr:HXXEE domain-containing protein [Vicinamibacterales bacterium]
MDADLRSVMVGLAPLYIIAGVALALTVARRVDTRRTDSCDMLVDVLLIGIAVQCLHFTEEFITGFCERAPRFVGLAPWSSEFFVTFNLMWLAAWMVAAVGIRHHVRVALFPVWFFALAMIANGLAHPLLSVATGGYFPGLYTSPMAGGMGIALASQLRKMTHVTSLNTATS